MTAACATDARPRVASQLSSCVPIAFAALQARVDRSDARLGIFASRAPRHVARCASPATARRQADCLMDLLVDPERTPTPPRAARRRSPCGLGSPPPPNAPGSAPDACVCGVSRSLSEGLRSERDVPGPPQRRAATAACPGNEAVERTGRAVPSGAKTPEGANKAVDRLAGVAQGGARGLEQFGPRLLKCGPFFSLQLLSAGAMRADYTFPVARGVAGIKFTRVPVARAARLCWLH